MARPAEHAAMDAERKAVVVDVGLGALCVAMGLLYASRGALPYWWLTAVTALLTVALAWADDHGVVGGWTTVVVVAAFGVAVLALGLVAGPAVVSAVIPAVLAGIGAGIVPYRLYYGVVRPVPSGRVADVGERAL
ncbi:hypothetical protein SAMN05216559_4191 [Halomicrobium zhouii]|uniref:Uncharacterized protein n=2 Tax=Halomicrobium zhouii TaxID=767519 RepID=A0A1I6MBV8_9EURY|nr:hypothetical protein SAMN05216559_4191 [Halomicrobium zhouii]